MSNETDGSEKNESSNSSLIPFGRREVFNNQMQGLIRLYNKDLDSQAVEAYWRGLEGIPDQALAGAFDNAIKVCKRFPTVSELRDGAPTDVRIVRKREDCDMCSGTGWFLIIEHWTYPATSTSFDKARRTIKREIWTREKVGKRWTDEEHMLNHELREAVIPCQCRTQ